MNKQNIFLKLIFWAFIESSGAGIELSDETSETSSDIEKYFILKNEPEKPKIPPKLSPEQKDRAHNVVPKSYDSESSSSDYAIPRNVSLFNLEKKESSKEFLPNFLTQDTEKVRDSSLLDKILLNPSTAEQNDKYLKLSNKENLDNENSENLENSKITDGKKSNLETDSLQSDEDYNSDEDNVGPSNVQPSAETLEIIKRLREIPSQSASPEMYGLRKLDSEMTRETKLSGGKQRKPNEESFDKSLKRTKSSNSMNSSVRNNFFNKLFGRDKASKQSTSGQSFKKKKSFFKK